MKVSFTIRDSSIEADTNNPLFQHEYGHVLQSRAFGFAYLSRVGIPSAFDNESYGRHAFHPVEADANRRAFLYFNRNDDGFQDDGVGKFNDGKGWDFVKNPFPTGVGVQRQISKTDKRQVNYVDFNNNAHTSSLNQLTLRPKWYDYFNPFGLNEIGTFNAYQYNKNGTK